MRTWNLGAKISWDNQNSHAHGATRGKRGDIGPWRGRFFFLVRWILRLWGFRYEKSVVRPGEIVLVPNKIPPYVVLGIFFPGQMVFPMSV